MSVRTEPPPRGVVTRGRRAGLLAVLSLIPFLLAALGFVDAAPRSVAADAPGERDERDDAGSACGLAFYDQIRKEVVLVDGRSSPDERAEVLAHELTHALQDQCFDLRARLRAIS